MGIVRHTRFIAGGIVLAASTAIPAIAQEPVDAGPCCNARIRPILLDEYGSRPQPQWKRRHQECWWGYPEEFCEPPLGHCVQATLAVQVRNGEGAQMVLYNFDFLNGSDRLSARGFDQLSKIAALLPTNSFKVVIEWIPENPDLAERRRLTVLSELARGSFPVPPERVIVGSAISGGLNGSDAVSVNNNLRHQTQTRGTLFGVSSGYGGNSGSNGNGMGRFSGQ